MSADEGAHTTWGAHRFLFATARTPCRVATGGRYDRGLCRAWRAFSRGRSTGALPPLMLTFSMTRWAVLYLYFEGSRARAALASSVRRRCVQPRFGGRPGGAGRTALVVVLWTAERHRSIRSRSRGRVGRAVPRAGLRPVNRRLTAIRKYRWENSTAVCHSRSAAPSGRSAWAREPFGRRSIEWRCGSRLVLDMAWERVEIIDSGTSTSWFYG